jgi:hypothetical protein
MRSAGGSRSSARHASPCIHTHRCASRVLSVRPTSGETQTLEAHVSVRHPLGAC